MGRLLAFVYGLVCYAFFFVTFLYLAGWLANVPQLPITVDNAVGGASLVEAIMVNLILVSLFGLSHTIMARPGFKEAWTKIVPKPIERSTYVLIASALLVLLMWQWRTMDGAIWTVTNSTAVYGLMGLFAAGWVIILLSSFLINHFDLFGLNQVFAYMLKKDLPRYKFATPLLYKIVRHPLYVGWIITFWATPMMTTGHLLFAITMTAYILIAIPYEEKDLVAYLGQEYVDYQGSVPKLVPFTPLGVKHPKGASEA